MSWRTITDRLKHNALVLRLADRLGRGRGRLRLHDWLLAAPPSPGIIPDLSDWETHRLAAAWLGHATVLIRIGGMTILTDPVFADRVGIGFGLFTAGPRRLIRPAVAIEKLPKIDLILISHAHFDHLDRPTLQLFDRRTPIIAACATSDLIRDLGYRNVRELAWGEKVSMNGLTITAREVNHWGARTFFDSHRGYNAYTIDSPQHRVLYAGDTAYQEAFRGVGPVDLMIVGIGAYDPYIRAHCTPEQAWEMTKHAEARHVMPIHHSTFRLSHEPMNEPIARLLAAANGERDRVVATRVGDLWFGA